MHKTTFQIIGSLTILASLTTATLAESCCKSMPMAKSPFQQATEAELVAIGKVIDIEPYMEMISHQPGAEKTGYLVATVQIEQSLLGGRGLTHVRIGFIPTMKWNVLQEDFGQQVRERFWNGPANLVQSQEACFFLQKHPTADFYVLVNRGNPLEKSELTYEQELKSVRQILKALERPIEALSAKEASDRQLAACALTLLYRTPVTQGKSVAAGTLVNLEESKLILEALSTMKWADTPLDMDGRFSLQNVFYQLQLSAKDGWQQPVQKANEDFNELMEKSVSKWLKDNAGKYRIMNLGAAVAKAD